MFDPTAPNSSRHLSNYNDPQDDTLSLQQQWQGLTQVPILPMHLHEDLAAGAVVHDSTRPDSNIYNSLASAAVDPNPFDFDVNDVNGLFGTPGFTQSQNEPSLMLGNSQNELGLMLGNQSEERIFGQSDVPSMASAANPSTAFNAADRWTLVDEASDPCYLNNVSMLGGVLSHRISNPPPQAHSVSYAATYNNAHACQLDNPLLGSRVRGPQYCFQDSMCDQYQFQGCSSFQMNVPSDMPWTPAPDPTYWDLSLGGDAKESTFRAPPNDFCPEVIPSIPHNPLKATCSHNPPENDTDSLEPGENASKFQKLTYVNKRPLVSTSANKQLGGRRTGPLTEEKRRKVKATRNAGACVPCHTNHAPCSPNKNEICDKCKTRTLSPFLRLFCPRDILGKYLELFIPSLMNKHLNQAAIEELTNSLVFNNNSFMIEMSTSPIHPPILIPACEYISPNDEFLLVSDLISNSNDHLQSFATTPTLPVAMHNYDPHQLKPLIMEHIKAISHSDKIPGDPETITVKLLKRICRFREANPSLEGNDLLLKAIMADRIYYVKSNYILISDSSAPKVLESLQNPPRATLNYLTSRLLNRQLKGLLYLFLKGLQKEVLDEFSSLKDKVGDNHLPYLCVFLVLCMCVERLQVDIDAFAFEAKKDLDAATVDAVTLKAKKAKIHKWAEENCIELERCAYHAWCFLFGYMKNHLEKKTNFINGSPRGGHSRYTEAEVKFIGDLRQIVREHEDKIIKKSKIKYSGGSSKFIADHKLFRCENPGRLISQTLKSIINPK